jgi:hypothetical protein
MSRTWLLLCCIAVAGGLAACSPDGSAASARTALSASTAIAAPAGLSPLTAGQQSGDLKVWLSSRPEQPVQGTADIEASLQGVDGKPLTGARVTFDTDMTNMSHGTYLVQADESGDGQYAGKVHFSMPGPWRIITTIDRPGAATVRLRFEFRVNGQ